MKRMDRYDKGDSCPLLRFSVPPGLGQRNDKATTYDPGLRHGVLAGNWFKLCQLFPEPMEPLAGQLVIRWVYDSFAYSAFRVMKTKRWNRNRV